MTAPGVTLAVPPPSEPVARLVGDAVAARVAAGDPTLFPAVARPGWVTAVRGARPLVGEVEGLRDRFRLAGLTRVVLATTGGVGVAAEVLAGPGTRLFVLDSTDPVQVADALAGDLDATVLVVSAPPGEDVAPLELVRDTAHRAFRAEGLDPDAHTVVVCPPGSPLLAHSAAATVVLGPPDVDGPWAAFTAYALLPAGLAGLDVGALLADAAAAREALVEAADRADPTDPVLALGSLLAATPVVALTAPGDPALAEWVAQLVGAGLGKDGHGPLPVVVEAPGAPGWETPGSLTVALEDTAPEGTALEGTALEGSALEGTGLADVVTTGTPAGQLLLWQHATAVAAHLLGVDPTDRPDAAGSSGAAPVPAEPAAFVDGMVAVHGGPWLPAGTRTVAGALRGLIDAAGGGDGTADGAGTGAHLAVHAYLDRHDDASAALLRAELARHTGLLTTFEWAPRSLPGAAQRAMGGPGNGVICQLTGSAADLDEFAGDDGDAEGSDAADGDRSDPLGALQQAGARADGAALARHGRPVLRLHLIDRVVGLVTLVRAVQEL